MIILESSVSEEEFWQGLQTPVLDKSFKRISIKKKENVIHTHIFKLKFLIPKLPNNISLFNMLFEVNPSIRSPVQCCCCLCFGHTQKFYRSDPRCSHCGVDKHSINVCPTIQVIGPDLSFL